MKEGRKQGQGMIKKRRKGERRVKGRREEIKMMSKGKKGEGKMRVQGAFSVVHFALGSVTARTHIPADFFIPTTVLPGQRSGRCGGDAYQVNLLASFPHQIVIVVVVSLGYASSRGPPRRGV